MTHTRLRDLGINIGLLTPGEHNAITDVPGVQVGYSTIIQDEPTIARTGVTMIVPRDGEINKNHTFAGYFSFNGCGEMTGAAIIEEFGILRTPIGLTNTMSVGIVHKALGADASGARLPVVAETFDGRLNDIAAQHVTEAHVQQALADARSGPIAEGNVGGGTGMLCHGFKGGTGTASRIVESESGRYTVGVLVQANHGGREHFRVDGVPVGLDIDAQHTPNAWREPQEEQESSIIIIVGTDAPLIPAQCKRLAKRATIGMARVGGNGHDGSGDIFLAFATGNDLPAEASAPYALKMIPHHHLNPFFWAVAEATEEAILNALVAAETMTGFQGRTAYALPHEDLQQVMKKYGRG